MIETFTCVCIRDAILADTFKYRIGKSAQHVTVSLRFGYICKHLLISSGRTSVCLVGWLVVLRINVDLAIFQPYLDLEAGDNQSLKIQVARPGIEPGPLAPQAKSLTTRPPLLPNLGMLFLKGYEKI